MEFSADTAAFQRGAAAIKTAAADVQAEFTTALRDIAKPYGQYVLLQGANQLPNKGGLRYRVASSTITTSVTTLRAAISLSNRQRYHLADMDKGTIRHPTFGHKPWVAQRIEPGIFSRPFAQGAPQIRTAMITAVSKVLRKLGAASQ